MPPLKSTEFMEVFCVRFRLNKLANYYAEKTVAYHICFLSYLGRIIIKYLGVSIFFSCSYIVSVDCKQSECVSAFGIHKTHRPSYGRCVSESG